ncbi:ester cyclase [Dactylosporangium cerinum]|uniref:Ester cyclase n=1 Tax=Dactylosporangium cerinum TaxID=1434730 RepID=A0ABV9W1U0_9ACTN
MDPRELVHRYIEILQTGAFDQLDKILAPDVYDHVGQQSGIQWWKDILSKLADGFSDTRTTIEHVLVDGEHVAVHLTVTGRQTGRFLPQLGPVEPSGKPFSWTHIHIFRVRDGLLAEHWAVRDDIGLAKQVGALPS